MQYFRIPGEVPVKKNTYRIRYQHGEVAGLRTTARVKEYEEEVAYELERQGMEPLSGKLEVIFRIYMRRERDVDGACTTLLDAMQYAGLYENDRAVVQQLNQKRLLPKGEEPYAEVLIGPFTAWWDEPSGPSAG